MQKLPSVDSILSNNNIKNLLDNYPRELILESIRDVIESKRQENHQNKRGWNRNIWYRGRHFNRWHNPSLQKINFNYLFKKL